MIVAMIIISDFCETLSSFLPDTKYAVNIYYWNIYFLIFWIKKSDSKNTVYEFNKLTFPA